jgi:hypothetical protein
MFKHRIHGDFSMAALEPSEASKKWLKGCVLSCYTNREEQSVFKA